MKKIFWLLTPVLFVGLILFPTSCGKTNLPANITAYNSSLTSTDRLNILDTLLVGVSSLRPQEQYIIQVIEVASNSVITTACFTADENGSIPPVAMWFDIGAVVTTEADQTYGEGEIDYSLTVKSYKIRVVGVTDTGTDFSLPFIIINDTTIPLAWAADSTGKLKNAFDEGTPVYVYGRNFTAGTTVDLYVTIDREWTFGDSLSGFDKTGTVESVAINSLGTLEATNAWNSASFESTFNASKPNPFDYSYDIVVDVNRNGIYDSGDVVDHAIYTGFVVQKPPVPDFKLQIASTGFNYSMYNSGNWGYADTYKKDASTLLTVSGSKGIRAIWNPYVSGVNAKLQSIYGRSVDVYVTATHPTDGQAIPVDVSGPGGAAQVDTIPVYPGCGNGCGQAIIWSGSLLRVGSSYEVVVDVDRNGTYEKGKDIVDGINADGSTVGFRIVN